MLRCKECGKLVAVFSRECPHCLAKNSLITEPKRIECRKIMEEKTGETVFYKTGFAGLDAMLGGGLARGMAYFIYGRPGIGKTTLLLQVLSAIQGGTDENSIYL